jgi:hypothetical protein
MILTTEETLAALRRAMQPLLEPLMQPLLEAAMEAAMEGVPTQVRGVLEEAEQQRTERIAEVVKEHAKGLAEVVAEHAMGFADIDAQRARLQQQIEAMRKHKEAQEGHVELNIGGYRFETSVQTLRRVPHTFFDAYFSGRYAQDVFFATVAFLSTGMASTSGTFSSTCAMVWCRWRGLGCIRVCPCCVC